ncbi:MAG TPA: flavodoxin family protein [Dehalococcoidales bacterium]|nr:flavodoxin family protein [Dehalococcoidales bacterium]
MKILAIGGSPRLNGNTNYLMDQSLQEAASLGAQTEKVVLSTLKLNPCLGHENCGSTKSCFQKDDGMALLDKFCEADGIILASPVYYFDVTSWMKIFIDRNYFLYRRGIRSKARSVGMIVLAGSTGIEDAIRTLDILVRYSISYVPEDKLFRVTGYARHPGDAEHNPALVNAARELARKMVKSLS